jgi:O-acetyl-ADP-ribose deacetylase
MRRSQRRANNPARLWRIPSSRTSWRAQWHADVVRITAVEGDITTQDVDAVVNAANTAMRGGGGVDGAIHRAGGPEILAQCIERFPHGLPTGAAGWTTGGRLPARYVIHVVGPNYRAGQRDPDLLASCYREAVRLADELGVRTMALPAVSAGIYGWPLDDAARVAVEAVGACGADVTVEEGRFVLFGRNVYEVFANEVSKWSRDRA